jgi:hypothetical protein
MRARGDWQGVGDQEKKQIPRGNGGKNGRALRARSRFFPFGYAQGQNDNQKNKSNDNDNSNSNSNSKGNDNSKGKMQGSLHCAFAKARTLRSR